MDLKTNKRIDEYKRKQKQLQRLSSSEKTLAEKQRMTKLHKATKKRPGFGSSVPSVADHLNEVVGLTEKKISNREKRDTRIEAAAKRGAGVRRYEEAAQKSNATKFKGAGQYLAARKQTQKPKQQAKDMREAREVFLQRLQSASTSSNIC